MTRAASSIAFLDASVLYPALLRNILMRLAVQGVFRARWSARVHDEWTEALLRNRPDISAANAVRIRALMDAHVQDALVEGYENRIASLVLPDADDRHVLAAAIHCSAHFIVTANLRDFPKPALKAFRIEPAHPDMFIARLLAAEPEAALAAFRRLRKALINPPLATDDLLAGMARQGLTESAGALQLLIRKADERFGDWMDEQTTQD